MSPSALRNASKAAVLAVGAALLAGCGVSTQSGPQGIQPSDVPFGLRQPQRPTTSEPLDATANLVVYFVGPSGLGSVSRDQRDAPSAQDAVEALTAGPTENEAREGFRSALVRRTIDEVQVENRLASVDLDPEFLQLGRTEQAFAIAQLVYTLTELETVDRVRLRVDGEPLPVAIADGRTTTAPIDRAQVVVPPSP